MGFLVGVFMTKKLMSISLHFPVILRLYLTKVCTIFLNYFELSSLTK